MALGGILNIVFTACWGKSLARSICEFAFGAGCSDLSLPTKEYVTSCYLTSSVSSLDTSPSYPTSREGGNFGRIQRQICGVDAVRMMGSKRSKKKDRCAEG